MYILYSFYRFSIRESCTVTNRNNWRLHHFNTETGRQERTDSNVLETSATWVQGHAECCCQVTNIFLFNPFFKLWKKKYGTLIWQFDSLAKSITKFVLDLFIFISWIILPTALWFSKIKKKKK